MDAFERAYYLRRILQEREAARIATSAEARERHEELVAASALGLPLLGEGERAELDRHLAEGCAVCEGLLADFRGAATALAAGVPVATPPPELKARILGALGPARVAPRDISYVETHGTGTALGDPIDLDTGDYANDGSDGDFSRRIGDHKNVMVGRSTSIRS